MRTLITMLACAAAMLAAGSAAHAQLDRPLTRDEHIACAGVAMAGSALTQNPRRAASRQALNYFVTAAAALDATRGTREAAEEANKAAYLASIRWLDAMFGKIPSEAEKRESIEKFRQDTANCVAVLQAYEGGVSGAKP